MKALLEYCCNEGKTKEVIITFLMQEFLVPKGSASGSLARARDRLHVKQDSKEKYHTTPLGLRFLAKTRTICQLDVDLSIVLTGIYYVHTDPKIKWVVNQTMTPPHALQHRKSTITVC